MNEDIEEWPELFLSGRGEMRMERGGERKVYLRRRRSDDSTIIERPTRWKTKGLTYGWTCRENGSRKGTEFVRFID